MQTKVTKSELGRRTGTRRGGGGPAPPPAPARAHARGCAALTRSRTRVDAPLLGLHKSQNHKLVVHHHTEQSQCADARPRPLTPRPGPPRSLPGLLRISRQARQHASGEDAKTHARGLAVRASGPHRRRRPAGCPRPRPWPPRRWLQRPAAPWQRHSARPGRCCRCRRLRRCFPPASPAA